MTNKAKKQTQRAELICPQCKRAAKQWFVDVLEGIVLERCPSCGFVRKQKLQRKGNKDVA